MKIIFLGTGEANDSQRRNTSILVENEESHHLLDCGFSSAHAYLAHSGDKMLKSIWISHFHGDHFFGIPQLIIHYNMLKREAPLTIFSGTNPRKKTQTAIDLAYPGLSEKLTFPLEFKQLTPDTEMFFNDLNWQSAPVSHTESSFALRLSTADFSLYYSGDGKPTLNAAELIKKCDIVIHEAYSMSPTTSSHSSIEECLLWAKKLLIKKLALVHISCETRSLLAADFHDLQASTSTQLYLPEDDDIFEF